MVLNDLVYRKLELPSNDIKNVLIEIIQNEPINNTKGK